MRRIQRDTRHEEFIRSLTTGDNAIFRDIWRVLLFAAAYGVHLGGRKPLQKVESNKAMPESYFGTPGWKGFLYLVGFLESTTGEHLRKEEEVENKLITAFEEFANFGLEEMQQKVSNPSTALTDIVGLMLDVSARRDLTVDLTDLI
jgi:dnd system-associated protein 4